MATTPVLRIGLIGNGTVGSAFVRAVESNAERFARYLVSRGIAESLLSRGIN